MPSWWLLALCKWRYKVINLSHDFIKRIFYIWNTTTHKIELTKCNAKKDVATSKRCIFTKRTQKLKTIFHNFVFKMETGWATRLVSPFYKLEISMHVFIHSSLFLTCKYLFGAQMLVNLELQLCPSNHRSRRGSWNLVIMILGDFSTRATHIFLGKVCHSTLKEY